MNFTKMQEEMLAYAAEKTKTPEYTLTECVRVPRKAWEVLNLLEKSNLVDNEVIDVESEEKERYRTLFGTVTMMGNFRKKFDKLADNDPSDDYQQFYDGIVEMFDTYASKVVCDLYETYGEIIFEIATDEKKKAAQAASARAKRAREAKQAKAAK